MGIEPALFTRLHPVAYLSTGRARGFRLVAKPLELRKNLKSYGARCACAIAFEILVLLPC